MRRLQQKGFTVIELIIVIFVIAMLLGVVAMAYKGVAARNHNQTRTAAVNTIQRQLETYYQASSHYPSLRDMNDPAWLVVNMKSLDQSILQDPTGPNVLLNSQPVVNHYAYQPVTISGTSCEANDTTCVVYTLTATLEGGGQYVQQNTN